MHRPTIAALTGLAMLVVAGSTLADNSQQMALVPEAAAVKWAPAPPTLPRGTQLAVLAGDPSQPGPFALRVKFPPNTLVAPHNHSTAENLTVLTGTLYHAMGQTADKSRGVAMHPGGFVYLPAGMDHYVWTTDTESVVQVTGTGPFGLNYVNPQDDPSKTQ